MVVRLSTASTVFTLLLQTSYPLFLAVAVILSLELVFFFTWKGTTERGGTSATGPLCCMGGGDGGSVCPTSLWRVAKGGGHPSRVAPMSEGSLEDTVADTDPLSKGRSGNSCKSKDCGDCDPSTPGCSSSVGSSSGIPCGESSSGLDPRHAAVSIGTGPGEEMSNESNVAVGNASVNGTCTLSTVRGPSRTYAHAERAVLLATE